MIHIIKFRQKRPEKKIQRENTTQFVNILRIGIEAEVKVNTNNKVNRLFIVHIVIIRLFSFF